MDLILKLASLLLSGGILYVGYAARRASGTWLTPASIWCVGWFLLTFIPLLVAISVPVNPLAILYILAISATLTAPVITTNWHNVNYAPKLDETHFDNAFLRFSFYISASIAIVSVGIHLSIQGVTLSSLFSNYFETSSALIADRYNQSTIENIFAQISNVFTYITVGLGGLVFPGYRSLLGRMRILVLAMAPSLALMAIAGAKGTIFLCIALFYGGTLVRRIRAGDNRLLDMKTLRRAILSLVVLLPFLTLSFLARGLYQESAQVDLSASLYRNFVSYSSAHVYAFSDWFSWYIGNESRLFYARDEVTGGFFTFMSIFKALGSTKEVPIGYFDEYFQYSWFLQTNIYTIFRGLITDFTLPGSFVFAYILGFFSNSLFIRMVTNNSASWSVSYYIIFSGFVYSSFLISVLVWSSMYPTFAVIGALLIVNNEKSARKSSEPLPAPTS